MPVWSMTKTTSIEPKLPRARGVLCACLIAGLGACTGAITDPLSGQPGGSTSTGSTGPGGTSGPGATGTGPGSTGTGATGTGGGKVSFTCQATTPQPGPSPMRLLTPDQYVNSVRDLLGDVTGLSAAFD